MKENRFNYKLRLKICKALYRETNSAVQTCIDAEVIYRWIKCGEHPLVSYVESDKDNLKGAS